MVKRPVTLITPRVVGNRVRSARALVAPSATRVVKARRVEHRNGAGHLQPTYEAELRARVRDRARNVSARAFVTRTSSTDRSAEESGEEFVLTVTSGEGAGQSALDKDSSEERGGPFVETHARVEFAYGTDGSNPTGAARQPFPTS